MPVILTKVVDTVYRIKSQIAQEIGDVREVYLSFAFFVDT